MPRIAAIIPTHNRAGFLEACLTSVCEQDIDPAVFEICIVNNCCTDATPEIVTRITAKYPHLNIFMVEEPKLGLSNARNCGVASTTAPLIAFGDDDATMPPDWLGRFLTRFDELGETVGKVGGQIDPVWGAPRPDWLIDRMLSMLSASAGHGTEAKFSDYPIVECNSCYRRSALIEAGGFPKNLGRIGTSLLSNDLVVDWIIRSKGHKLFYDPQIVIRHFIHADRLTPAWFRRRYFWQGVSDYAGILYLNTHNLTFSDTITPVLPTSAVDWNFVNDPNNAMDLEPSLVKLRWLGFSLTMAGIIQVANP